MKCPFCGTTESSVLESRISEDEQSIRRRRECSKCGKRFTTYERVEGLDLVVIKKDGRRESFDRDKLRKGLMKATWKRPVTIEQIEALVDEVERKKLPGVSVSRDLEVNPVLGRLLEPQGLVVEEDEGKRTVAARGDVLQRNSPLPSPHG